MALCKRLNEAIDSARQYKELPADFEAVLNAIARRLSYGDDSVTDSDRAHANAFIMGVAKFQTGVINVAPVIPINSVVLRRPWMKFKATDEMAKKLAHNACNAAGLDMPIDKISIDVSGPRAGIDIGNVGGKAINLFLKKVGADEWYIREDMTDPEQHRWLQSYKTVKNLLNSVRGIRLGIQDADPKAVQAQKDAEAKADAEKSAQLAKSRESAKAQQRTPEQRQAAKANKEKATAAAKEPVVDPDAKEEPAAKDKKKKK